MSNNNNTIQNIISLHNLILSQHRHGEKDVGVEKMNQLLKEINEIGFIEGLGVEGIKGRYLLIEGRSWEHACRNMHDVITPSFVMWEETEFMTFLKSLITSTIPSQIKPTQ